VIFGDSCINEPVIDIEGDYGMTQHAIGIQVENNKEAESISKTLKSELFQSDVIKACTYAGRAFEWRIFQYFKRDWWKVVDGWK